MKLGKMREEYQTDPLKKNVLEKNPFKQFEKWFKNASNVAIPEPNAMTLATLEETGYISQRIVLLKHFDEMGFVFFTNYNSRKAKAIHFQPKVSLGFFWPTLQQQITIQGLAQKITQEASEKYFQSRPRSSQLGAWASYQSQPVNKRATILENLEKVTKRFENQTIPIPPHWGGYCVIPETFEFWQGGASRLHDRFLYYKQVQDSLTSWIIQRLYP